MGSFDLYPKVALEFMNVDHAAFSVLANELEQALAGEQVDQQRIDGLLRHLQEHCREHFAREEEQMEKVRFPPYSVHKAEHDRVLAELEGVMNRWQFNHDEDAISQYVEQLSDWFVRHIATMDTVTANFIERRVC